MPGYKCVRLCQGTSPVSLCMRVCVSCMGTLWDWLGQFLKNHLCATNRRWQQPDLAFPCSWPDVASLCPCPELCRMVRMPVTRPLGRPLPTPLAQLATLAKEPGLESGTFGCSLRHFLPPCPSDTQNTLCSANDSGWGDDMNVTGGDTFCPCFKESDVPFVNIQEKY